MNSTMHRNIWGVLTAQAAIADILRRLDFGFEHPFQIFDSPPLDLKGTVGEHECLVFWRDGLSLTTMKGQVKGWLYDGFYLAEAPGFIYPFQSISLCRVQSSHFLDSIYDYCVRERPYLFPDEVKRNLYIAKKKTSVEMCYYTYSEKYKEDKRFKYAIEFLEGMAQDIDVLPTNHKSNSSQN
jgi:hypothetical protein